MLTFVLILVATLIALGLIFGVADKSEDGDDNGKPLTLLPGDIKYESPSGNFKFYFPVTTSIILSIVLTLVLRLFG